LSNLVDFWRILTALREIQTKEAPPRPYISAIKLMSKQAQKPLKHD